MDEPDPFSCFGDGDEDEDPEVLSNDLPSQTPSEKGESVKRDPSCGILAFHSGTEQSLLKHVENELLQCKETVDLAAFVLDSVDKFCLKRHWMMHVGNEKAKIMQKFVEQCCSSCPSNRSLVFVELGTYCGYSSIMLARTLSRIGSDFHIYSIEVVGEHAQVAKEMIRFAGFEDKIDCLLLDPDKETLTALLKSKISTDFIDFLFIDHDKSLYLSDLQQLEVSGLMKKGCFVAADNVVFARIDEYRRYMSVLASKGHVKTQLEDCSLEYSEPDYDGDESKKVLLEDGIGTLLSGFVLLSVWMIGILKCSCSLRSVQNSRFILIIHHFCDLDVIKANP
jgi:catechol O-methyltransferase